METENSMEMKICISMYAEKCIVSRQGVRTLVDKRPKGLLKDYLLPDKPLKKSSDCQKK